MNGPVKSAPLPADGFPMPEIDSRGVDRSQIRRQLTRTPAERLRALESFLASIIRIRRGIRTPVSGTGNGFRESLRQK
jgi:hypothetical protein